MDMKHSFMCVLTIYVMNQYEQLQRRSFHLANLDLLSVALMLLQRDPGPGLVLAAGTYEEE